MTNDQEITKFLRDFFEMFSIPPSAAKTQIWKDALSPYSIAALKAAAVALSREAKHGGGTLLPGALMQYLPSQLGHPTPEIAWNHTPADEYSCGWITDQMAGAMADAQGSLERGDHIAGRVCFIESYKARVRAAEAQKIPAKFWYSAPSCLTYEQRLAIKETKTIQAAKNGWLTHEKTKSVLNAILNESGSVSAQALELIQDTVALTKLRITDGSQKTKQALNLLPAPKSTLVDQYPGIKADIQADREAKALAEEQQRKRNIEHMQRVKEQAAMILNFNDPVGKTQGV